jgi:hypothetical protein
MTDSECQDVSNNMHKQLSGLHGTQNHSESASAYNIETVGLFCVCVCGGGGGGED